MSKSVDSLCQQIQQEVQNREQQQQVRICELEARVLELEENREEDRGRHEAELEQANSMIATQRSLLRRRDAETRRLQEQVRTTEEQMWREARRRHQVESEMVHLKDASDRTVQETEEYTLLRVEEADRRARVSEQECQTAIRRWRLMRRQRNVARAERDAAVEAAYRMRVEHKIDEELRERDDGSA
jgi:hypothetical protein